MKHFLFAIALIATPALAQDATLEKLDAAKRAYVEKTQAEAIAAAVDVDVEGINVRVDMKSQEGDGPGHPSVQQDVVIGPADPEFTTVLEAAKAAMARKATAAAQKLEESGVVFEVAPAPAEEK